MNNLKFRAWYKELKRICKIQKIDYSFTPPAFTLGIDGYRRTPIYGLDNIELMQFTGHQDKNGTDIYLGDIVESYCDDNDDGLSKYEIIWLEDGFMANSCKSGASYYLYQVINLSTIIIGNIYETPELIEE